MPTDYLVESRSKNAWQQPVADKDLTISPGGASKGDRHIIAGTGGDWSGGAINDIAQYNGATWDFATPVEGWICWIEDENKYYYFDGSDWKPNKTATFGITIDGGGAVISTGIKGYIEIPYDCTITKWTLLGDQSGSIKIDVWKDTYANYPPTNDDTITNGHEPEISAAIKAQDTDLSDWSSVAVTAGDIIAFNVDSCATIERATLVLYVTKT